MSQMSQMSQLNNSLIVERDKIFLISHKCHKHKEAININHKKKKMSQNLSHHLSRLYYL